jgi:hypothetical protein
MGGILVQGFAGRGGNPSTKAKNRYNKENYAQIKICTAPELADAFRAACERGGVSMSSEISGFMRARAGLGEPPAKPHGGLFSTRRLRRRRMKEAIALLEGMLRAEQDGLDNTPENLAESPGSEVSAEIIERLEEAVGLCGEVYG